MRNVLYSNKVKIHKDIHFQKNHEKYNPAKQFNFDS